MFSDHSPFELVNTQQTQVTVNQQSKAIKKHIKNVKIVAKGCLKAYNDDKENYRPQGAKTGRKSDKINGKKAFSG